VLKSYANRPRRRFVTPLIAATGFLLSYYWASLSFDKATKIGTPYFSISLALNIILTLMIVTRLVLHYRSIRDALGFVVRLKRLYGAIVSILIESAALYAVSFILYMGPWIAGNDSQLIFLPILTQTQVCAVFFFCRFLAHLRALLIGCGDKQVIAPFLIILRAAKNRAMMNDTISSQDLGSIQWNAGKSTTENFPEGQLTESTGTNGETSTSLGTPVDPNPVEVC
jgi:hypothetical protein